MLNQIKIIELFISLESIIISTFLPLYISLPSNKSIIYTLQIPITWQVPIIIFLTIIFTGEVVYKAYTIYILIGLFLLPVFYDGGSLGYILTPNFGYLIGIFPLIKIINNLSKKDQFTIQEFIKYSIFSIILMHTVGILFTSIQLILFNKINSISFIIGKYTFSKIIFEILLLFPILILLKPFKKIYYL